MYLIVFLYHVVKTVISFQMLGSPESKPSFLSDKNLEPVIKAIQKKFPAIDTKSNSVCKVYEYLVDK